MGLIGSLVLGMIIVFIALVYFVITVAFFSEISLWRKSIKVRGQIVNIIEEKKYALGSHAVGSVRYRKFYVYNVMFYVNGIKYVMQTELAEKDLLAGTWVDLRYYFNNKKSQIGMVSVDLLSYGYKSWITEMFVGYTLGLLFGVGCAIYYYYFK